MIVTCVYRRQPCFERVLLKGHRGDGEMGGQQTFGLRTMDEASARDLLSALGFSLTKEGAEYIVQDRRALPECTAFSCTSS